MRARLRLRIARSSMRAELVRRGHVLWAGEAGFVTPAELEEAVSQLAAGASLPARPVAIGVELERPLAQVRTLRGLPPVRTTQLRALVATQSGRFFRRNGKPLVTDACWAGSQTRREGTAVAAAVEEPWLLAVVEGARAAGLPVETLRPVDLPSGVRLELLPQAERRRRRGAALLSLRRFVLAATLAWLAAAVAFLVRTRRERAEVDREVARLETPVEAVRRARRALGEAAAMVETMDRARLRRGRVLAQFSTVAGSLPDSAFVTAFVITAEGRGEMQVVARRSSEVLAALERSAAALAPTVTGSVVRETVAGRDWERFTAGFAAGSAR